jgi:hypothetical protein
MPMNFLDHQNAQIVLAGAREGRNKIKQDLGIDIENENERSADIFTRLRLQKEQVPIRPLMRGRLE